MEPEIPGDTRQDGPAHRLDPLPYGNEPPATRQQPAGGRRSPQSPRNDPRSTRSCGGIPYSAPSRQLVLLVRRPDPGSRSRSHAGDRRSVSVVVSGLFPAAPFHRIGEQAGLTGSHLLPSARAQKTCKSDIPARPDGDLGWQSPLQEIRTSSMAATPRRTRNSQSLSRGGGDEVRTWSGRTAFYLDATPDQGAGTSWTVLGGAGAKAGVRRWLPAAVMKPAPHISVVWGTSTSAR